jgi:hypothetical protein
LTRNEITNLKKREMMQLKVTEERGSWLKNAKSLQNERPSHMWGLKGRGRKKGENSPRNLAAL